MPRVRWTPFSIVLLALTAWSVGAEAAEIGLGQAPAISREAEELGSFRLYDCLRDDAGIERVVCFALRDDGPSRVRGL